MMLLFLIIAMFAGVAVGPGWYAIPIGLLHYYFGVYRTTPSSVKDHALVASLYVFGTFVFMAICEAIANILFR